MTEPGAGLVCSERGVLHHATDHLLLLAPLYVSDMYCQPHVSPVCVSTMHVPTVFFSTL